MVNNPNTVLRAAPSPQITSTTTLQVASDDASLPGGGTANIAFLTGTAHSNANAAHVTATFWLETLQGDTEPSRLQYSQLVLLLFNGISWPHRTVATLQKS
jgi:hypothetical protein